MRYAISLADAAPAVRKAFFKQIRFLERDLHPHRYGLGDTVFFTLLYAKKELENLTDDQEKELKRLAQAIEDF